MTDDINMKVAARLKELLFDDTMPEYKNLEIIMSESGDKQEFLFWKLQPTDWERFCNDMQKLVEQDGYKMLAGACDVSTYNPETKTGYKVVAFQKA